MIYKLEFKYIETALVIWLYFEYQFWVPFVETVFVYLKSSMEFFFFPSEFGGKGWWGFIERQIYALILIYFSTIDFRMRMAATQYMKTELLVSFHLLQEFHECLDWYLEILVSWMIVKIHFKSCQILHINVLISSAVEIKMDSFALVYLGSFQ